MIIPHAESRGNLELQKCIKSLEKDAQESGFTIEIIVETDGNVSQARNRAIQKAKYEILVFVDSDVEIRSGCLKELTYPFQDPDVGLVSGVNIAFPEISGIEELVACLYSSPLIMLKSAARYTPRGNIRNTDESELISCVMAARKKALWLAGGFPEKNYPCEENILINKLKKLRYKTLYNPFAVVFHHRARSLPEFVHKSFNYGLGRGMMIRKGYGAPRMFWQPSRRWLYFAALAFLHYVSYIAGLIKGLWKGEQQK